MSWTILVALLAGLAGAVVSSLMRRTELRRMRGLVDELGEAKTRGSHKARLQYPQVDLASCLGCGTCISACPEEGVLELIHGQAIVMHGARCVGHGRCAEECPTGAIVVALGDIDKRDDIPAVDEHFEIPNEPGLFLAGEVTGFALIRTAITHGVAVARAAAERLHSMPPHADGILDLCVVGAGPAGIACALEAHELGLSQVVIEQETLGGTVASYPRRKLVMTQPVDLPGHGRLNRRDYEKEELMELWSQIVAEQELPVRTGVRFQRTERRADGSFDVHTDRGIVRARNVCLALGRRGSPRKLGVPGEDLPKVAYSLLDAQSYTGRRVLVVGGGDSAIEAALGLADQPGNQVTLSYRKEAFFRLKARNEKRIQAALESGAIAAVFGSEVARITPDTVELTAGQGQVVLPNDEVFVLAGGIPPFKMLQDCGVSFAPEDRPPPPLQAERGSGLLTSLSVAAAIALAALGWVVLRADYYMLTREQRPDSPWHDQLSPSGSVGLVLGVIALVLLLTNLAYLARRFAPEALRKGSLRAWMTLHVATGLLTLIFALVHGAMDPRDTVGGHAFLGLVVLVITGSVGRYLYSFVPHAANGRELEHDEVRGELASLSAEWDRGNRAFADRARRALAELVPEERWRASLPRRIALLLRAHWRTRRTLAQLRSSGRAEGIPEDQLARTITLARRAQRAAFAASHFEEVRGVLSSWRYLHRWVALLVVLLVLVHVLVALRYGRVM